MKSDRRQPAFLWLLAAPIALLGAQTAQAASKPEHAIIFIIDGLSYKAIDRLPLKNLKALIDSGTYCEESYNLLPAHPKEGEWAKYNSSSIPNPVILAGTVLLHRDQQYVQHSFFPNRVTAHVVNSLAYTTLNGGFHFSAMLGSVGDRRAEDKDAVDWAIDFLRKGRPAFMRIHLQDTGSGGSACRDTTNRSVTWYRNIWGDGSPYVKSALRADELLGVFVDELKRLKLMEKTVLFVTADHGQADTGWHPYEERDSWTMPLVLAGAGVRSGQRFEYAEQIDIVPTLCFLMGAKPPENADGRILAEALVEPPRQVARHRHQIRELNELIVRIETKLEQFRRKAQKAASLKRAVDEAKRDFYGLERILDWQRFGTVEKLLAHNRAVLEKLEAAEHDVR